MLPLFHVILHIRWHDRLMMMQDLFSISVIAKTNSILESETTLAPKKFGKNQLRYQKTNEIEARDPLMSAS